MTPEEAAVERLSKLAQSHIVDPTPLEPYGRYHATFGDLRLILADRERMRGALDAAQRCIDVNDAVVTRMVECSTDGGSLAMAHAGADMFGDALEELRAALSALQGEEGGGA